MLAYVKTNLNTGEQNKKRIPDNFFYRYQRQALMEGHPIIRTAKSLTIIYPNKNISITLTKR